MNRLEDLRTLAAACDLVILHGERMCARLLANYPDAAEAIEAERRKLVRERARVDQARAEIERMAKDGVS